jgi:hypothetical protein
MVWADHGSVLRIPGASGGIFFPIRIRARRVSTAFFPGRAALTSHQHVRMRRNYISCLAPRFILILTIFPGIYR